MNESSPKVSIVLPTYNGAKYIRQSIDSCLNQTYQNIELVIVDDGSTDNTAKIVSGLQGNVRYFYQSNSGPAAARNRGIGMAAGDVIGFLDVDDLWSGHKLQRQLDYFVEDPSLEIVLGLLQRMQLVGVEGGKYKFKDWAEPVMSMHLGSALFRRSVFQKVGLFDESLNHCEDCDWFMRAKERQVTMKLHKEVTYYYRRHNQNITNDIETNLSFALKMLRYSLDRRRQQGNGQITQLPKISDFAANHSGYSHKPKAKK